MNKVKINYLQQDCSDRIITSATEPVKSVLSVQLGKVSSALSEVDEYVKDIDKYCRGRFGWETQREMIHSNYANLFETRHFDGEYQKEY